MSDKNNITESLLGKYVLDEELVPPTYIVFYKGAGRQLTYWPVDREALLALADELSGDTFVVPAVYGTYAGGYVAACQDVARRIREALGVTDG